MSRSFLMNGNEMFTEIDPLDETPSNQNYFDRYEEEDYETTNEVKGLVDDQVPLMPDDYYQNFEEFMRKGPPKISGDKLKKQSNKSDNKNENSAAEKGNKISLPQIKKREENNNSLKKKIDPKLLAQAFAYVDEISQQDIVEEDNEMDKSKSNTSQNFINPPRLGINPYDAPPHPRSAPPEITNPKLVDDGPYVQSSTKKKSKSKQYGAVKKLRNQTQMYNDTDFNVDTTEKHDYKRAALDFDSLVENFQQGITLSKLQEELNESKKSMARSEEFMKQLAKDFMSKR